MTKEEAIKYLQQLYPNGGHCWLDEQRIEAIGIAVKSLQEEPASEDLEEEIRKYQKEVYDGDTTVRDIARHFANWQREQLFKLKEGVEPWSEEYEDNFEDEFAKTLAEKKEILPRGEERFSDMDMYRVALHFSGWQKQQIMKDVIEATIIKTRVTNQTMAPTLSSVILSDAFHEGDKVKVKIFKED